MGYKNKSPEGKQLDHLYSTERCRAQRLLDEGKAREKHKRLIPVHLGAKSIYPVPGGTDLEKWKEKKNRNLEKFRSNDTFQH
jgi:hypothetical protein